MHVYAHTCNYVHRRRGCQRFSCAEAGRKKGRAKHTVLSDSEKTCVSHWCEVAMCRVWLTVRRVTLSFCDAMGPGCIALPPACNAVTFLLMT